MFAFAGETGDELVLGGDALVVVEALEGASSDTASRAGLTRREFEWSGGDDGLAGMTKTSTCALHETLRAGWRQTSTCVSQLTDRVDGRLTHRDRVWSGFRAVSSGGGRRELRRETVLVLLAVLSLLALLAVRRFGEIWWNDAAESMLCGGESEGKSVFWLPPFEGPES